MAWRGGELLGLTHIDEADGVAGGKALLQFESLDPCRRIGVRPLKQTDRNPVIASNSRC